MQKFVESNIRVNKGTVALETTRAWTPIVHRITMDINVRASQCRTFPNGGSITLKDGTLEFKKGTKTTVVEQKEIDENGVDFSDKYRNECN